MLTDSGLRLAPDGLDQFSMELQNIYAALAKAEDRLWITWPAGDRRGRTVFSWLYVLRHWTLCPQGVYKQKQDRASRLPAGERPLFPARQGRKARGGSLALFCCAPMPASLPSMD